MKKVSILICTFFCLTSLTYTQAIPNFSTHVCSRVTQIQDSMPHPASRETSQNNRRSVPCLYDSAEDFASLTQAQLFNYLVSEDDPFECVYRQLFDFNTSASPSVFTSANVNYVALNGIALANSYNGSDNNGLYGIISYLSIASQMSTYHGLNYTTTTWNRIKTLAKAITTNPNSLSETSLSLRINAEMYNTMSASEVNDMQELIPYTKTLLDKLANDSYTQVNSLYDYYYCYYFILDVYFRFAPNNSEHIGELVSQPALIQSLGEVATNMNLNDDTFQFFDDISSFSVSALARYAAAPELASVITPVLNDVTESYPEYSVHWTTAAIALVTNDLPFHLDEDVIISNLEASLLPNNFEFDNGKFIISTPLTFEESKSLYEGAQQVKAQFFSLLQDDTPLIGDTNDTIRVKLYGSPADYQNYNGILYDVNYPNSGGVYIEAYGTFYTYQRTPEESTYTVEELFRHEYTHYLQGRYIVPGIWGGSPYYDDNRLVWFEEGMAQFLAGSTASQGVLGLNVVRNVLVNESSYQSLTDVFNSSYSSGNFNAFYIYGPMVWSSWYQDNKSFIKDLFGYIRNSQLNLFDSTIDGLRNNTQENTHYHQHIGQQVAQADLWQTPSTSILLAEDVDFASADMLQNAVMTANNQLTQIDVTFNGPDEDRRFEITASVPLASGMTIEQLTADAEMKLNTLIQNLAMQSSINSFSYSTGYVTDIQAGPIATAVFHLMGPANEGCGEADKDQMSSKSFSTYAQLFAPNIRPRKHQFRYRELDESIWIELAETAVQVQRVDNIFSLQGYEYQIRYECEADNWSTYSDSKTFYQCPDQRDLSNLPLTFDASFRAAFKVISAGSVQSQAKIEFVAGGYVDILPGFEVVSGGELLIDTENCNLRH